MSHSDQQKWNINSLVAAPPSTDKAGRHDAQAGEAVEGALEGAQRGVAYGHHDPR